MILVTATVVLASLRCASCTAVVLRLLRIRLLALRPMPSSRVLLVPSPEWLSRTLDIRCPLLPIRRRRKRVALVASSTKHPQFLVALSVIKIPRGNPAAAAKTTALTLGLK
jgi:hypothetical protein